jgi:hypothetical protein
MTWYFPFDIVNRVPSSRPASRQAKVTYPPPPYLIDISFLHFHNFPSFERSLGTADTTTAPHRTVRDLEPAFSGHRHDCRLPTGSSGPT